MKGFLGNTRPGLFARGAGLVGPALLSLALFAGVTARPMMSLARTQEELHVAQERAAERGPLARRQRAFSSARGEERLRRALAELRRRIPSGCSIAAAHGLARAAARQAGLAVETVDVGALVDAGLPGTSDRVAMREVELGGRGSLASVRGCVERLRASGVPCAVRELLIERPSASDERFDVSLTLGLVHFAPLEELPPAEGDPAEQAP